MILYARGVRIHAAFTLALVATACGPATITTVQPPKSTPPPAKATSIPSESPARWVLLPSGGVTADARLVVEGVGTVFVGRSGDRWLEKKGGGLIAAETLIPEPVRGLVRDESGRFAFVGASGSVFFTKEPLGAVVETRTTKAKLRSVAVGKRAILAVSGAGLVRSADLGATWAPVTLPKINGVLAQVAMLGTEALALAAPQQVFASVDDGATFQAVATPGVGARRVVADANGDLILEGLTASAVLRSSPVRLEKIVRAPNAGWDLPVTETHGVLLGADAVFSGAAAIVGNRYVEAVQDQDITERWRIAVTELGKNPILRQPGELEHCDRVFVTGSGTTILAACVNPVSNGGGPKAKWGPMPGIGMQARFLKSGDGGVTWKDDGTVSSSDRDKLMWLSPEGLLLIDGACKRTHSEYECAESPPVVRPAGAKTFAKAVSAQGARFEKVAFSPNGRAFALGVDASARSALYISTNGGRDFSRKGLPPVQDEKGTAFTATGGGAIGVDESGVYIVVRSETGRLIRYVGAADGSNLQPKLIDADLDSFDLFGRRGFAVGGSGQGFETADGGATWKKVAAPTVTTVGTPDRLVACGEYGCVLGDRATRVGWDLPLGTATANEAPVATKKTIGRPPIKCTTDGEWKPLANVAGGSTANADLGGSTKWTLAKRDPAKGALAAVVGTIGAKGAETKEIALFGPGQADSAGIAVMQVEGVAALRYNFKRDKNPAPPMPPPKPPISGKYPYPAPPYVKASSNTAKQVVDVEVAWYVAATGKVHKGIIKAAGAIDPAKDISDMRDQASIARTSLLSIAANGVHVRPFQSAGADSPLYFLSTTGKVEKLVWPEVPSKDLRGKAMALRLDAARIGGRSVVFGDTNGGLQMFLAWANPAGNAWESRTWGLWPELEDSRDAYLRFIDSGDKPIVGVIAPGNKDVAPAAFAVAIEGNKADPEVLAMLPTQKSMPDVPRACGKTAHPWRISAPWSNGTRHPIVVSTDGREVLFASSNEILRSGPNAEPCVSAMDAQQITFLGSSKPAPGTNEWYSLLLYPDDLAHSTLWRTSWKSGSGNETAVRSMSCTVSLGGSGGAIPEQLANTPGFSD